MHIHKPKATHSVREFLSEIGVIVVGIAIALSGEQAIEALHWRHVGEHTVQDLDNEVRKDLQYMADRQSNKECLKARLADLRDKLLASNGAWKADAFQLRHPIPNGPHEVVPGHVMPIVHGLPFFGFTHQAWDAARASGALSHVPGEKLAFYSAFYEEVERLNGWQAAESEAAERLTPLAYDTRLEHRDRDARLADLAAVDANAFYIDELSRNLLDDARAQGLKPDPAELARFIKGSREIVGACVKDPGP
jgi:hypothetical protein